MDRIWTLEMPRRTVAGWLEKLAIVADDHGLETEFLPPTTTAGEPAAAVHSPPTRAA